MPSLIPAPGVNAALPRRLFFSFSLICLLLAGVGGYVSFSLRSLQNLSRSEGDTAVRKIAVLRGVADDTVFLQAQILRSIASGISVEVSLERIISRIQENNSSKLTAFDRSGLTEAERSLYGEVVGKRVAYQSQTHRLLSSHQDNPGDTLAKRSAQEQAYNAYQQSLGKLIRLGESEDRELAEQASGQISRTKLLSDTLIAIAIVVAAGTGITILHVVQKLREDHKRLLEEIGQRRQADKALGASEERYRTLLGRIPEAVYVVHENRIVFANPAAERLFIGAGPGSIVDQPLEQFFPPEDRSEINARIAAISHRNAPRPTERRLLRRDGTLLDVEVNAMPTEFAGRAAIQVIARDIGEQKRNEESLLAQGRQYRLLFEDSPSPMWVFEPNSLGFIAVNRTATERYGYTREEFLRLTLLDIHPGADEALLRQTIAQLQGPDFYAGNWEHRTKEGRILNVEVYSSPIVFDGREARLTTVNDITQRAESERKIRESEASMSLAQHVAGVGSWEYAILPDGRTDGDLIWSAEVYHLFGRSPEDFHPSTRTYYEAIHPDDRAEVKQCFHKLRYSGGRFDTDHRIILPDGTQRTLHIAAEVVRNQKSGCPEKVIGIAMDITERVAAEEALKQAEEKYRAIFTNASEGIFQSTPEGRFLVVNPAAARIFGFDSPAQMIDSRSDISRQGYVSPQRRADFIRLIDENDVVTNFEYEVYRKDGSTTWVSENARAVRDPQGRILYYEGTLQDITHRKEALRQLREQAELIDLAHDAIMVRDMEDRIEVWSAGAERLYGWTAEEVRGRPIMEFLTNLDPKVMEAAHEIFLKTGSWIGEKKDRNKNGDAVIVRSRWSLVLDEFGQPKSKLVINTDITAEKRMEQQFLRTQRLESIGTLASGIAHDLNNVLLPILMAAPVLRDEPDAEERSRFLDIVEESALRGASIVKQVVTFARGADGERTLLQPAYLIDEIAKIVKETFPKSITLSIDQHADLCMVEADPTQLHQVLLNLCINARDALPNGGLITLEAENTEVHEETLGCTPDVEPGSYLCLSVTDSGEGIPPEILPQVFDPFFTTKDIGKGTGLGLSTVSGIVKSHGGFIGVQSEPGQTQFKIYLPAHCPVVRSSAAPSVESTPPAVEGKTIMVVDDESSIRLVSEVILRQHGYRVLLASDGPEALNLMDAHRGEIDLVVTDLAMPVMSGLVLVRALRKIQRDLKIIVSTGRAEEFEPAEIARLEINDTLSKPYRMKSLLLKVDSLVEATKSAAA